ncbi:hypothetical protein AVEN_162939-1 [Araneus ventricosus]|uniref:Uncharacterized protein n=1 Tax=Araneus ventricosus TaxID=182803 RepID=A0A4Y2C137_ARAVE|nr:hypothetical protein AVEN_162939-1 [Araneus ventricosus]
MKITPPGACAKARRVSESVAKQYIFLVCTRGRGGLVQNPIPQKIRRVWGLLHAKSYVVAKRPPVGVARKLGEGVPAQVSSSSSDHGSKLRVPSLNSPRVASKRDVNAT